MIVKEIFKEYPDFVQYLIDNNIETIDDLTISDVLLGVKGKSNYTNIITTYLELRRKNIRFNVKINKIDLIFETSRYNNHKSVKKLNDIKSKWQKINVPFESITIKSLLSLFIKVLSYNSNNLELKLNENLTKEGIINIKHAMILIKEMFSVKVISNDLLNKILIFNTFIKCKEINRNIYQIDYYRKLISTKNMKNYVYSFISPKAVNYLLNHNVATFEDLFHYLNDLTYSTLYTNIVNTIPYLIETNKDNILCDYVIENEIGKAGLLNDLSIAMMKIKGMKDSDICEIKNISYKVSLKAYYNILEFLCDFFDTYKGRFYIMYLLSLDKGYVSLNKVKSILSKYYLLINDLVKKNLIYLISYNENYNIYTYRSIKDEEEIFERYKYNIDEEEYIDLKEKLNQYLINNGIVITEELLEKRINKVYKQVKTINNLKVYSKGYMSNQYKVFKIYDEYYSDGIKDTEFNDFNQKYIECFNEDNLIDKKTHFFNKKNNYYVLKKDILKKYSKLYVNKDDESNLIIRVCESMKSIFDVKSVASELNIEEKKVKKVLLSSHMYYQISYSLFIKSDDLIIDNNLMKLFIKLYNKNSNEIYKEVEERHKGFLKAYNINNKEILRRIVRRVVSKKTKILAIYD